MGAEEFLPDRLTLTSMREAVDGCRGCDLWRDATRGVMGEGRRDARLILVGEQPGDREDLEGKPFVGPAGRLLDTSLEEAGIDRSEAFVTNVVKHFRFEQRGKRRIHKKPSAEHVEACKPWLRAELSAVSPRALGALGATAAQAILGRSFRVTRQRGELLEGTGIAPVVMATVHPSSILRAPDGETRELERKRFVEDLRHIAGVLGR